MAKPKYETWHDSDSLIRLEGWARDGLTQEQIATNMGISLATLKNWKKNHLAILTALKRGKEVIDYEVENALLKSALGYTYEEDVMSASGKVERVTKYQAPSTTAQIFWLKNRKPDQWREKQQLEVTTTTSEKVAEIEAYMNAKK